MVSPKSRSWWILWICVCPWFVRAPKVLQLCTNQLVWFVWFVWIIDLLVTLPSPQPRVPTRPSTPKVLWVREHTPIHHSSVVFTLDSHLSLSRSLGVHHLRYLGQQHMFYYYILKCNYFLNKTSSLYIGIFNNVFYCLVERWFFRV
jgi:hypothetical protein